MLYILKKITNNVISFLKSLSTPIQPVGEEKNSGSQQCHCAQNTQNPTISSPFSYSNLLCLLYSGYIA
jgi:hypothetical protein